MHLELGLVLEQTWLVNVSVFGKVFGSIKAPVEPLGREPLQLVTQWTIQVY